MSSPISIDGQFNFTQRDYEMYKNRSLKSKFNLKEVIWEYVKGFLVIGFFLVALLGWQIALAAPTCSFDYHTGITTCV